MSAEIAPGYALSKSLTIPSGFAPNSLSIIWAALTPSGCLNRGQSAKRFLNRVNHNQNRHFSSAHGDEDLVDTQNGIEREFPLWLPRDP
jgi:hypothetical protein